MARKIQFKQGNKVHLPTLAPGEPGFTLDTKEIFIGGAPGDGNIDVTQREKLADIDQQLAENMTDKLGRGYNIKYPPAPLSAAKGDGVTNDKAVIQALIDYVSSNGGGKVIIPSSSSDFMISDTVLVKSNVSIEFTGSSYLKLLNSTTQGGILIVYSGDPSIITENVTIINPLIDGNDFGYPKANLYGENGVGGTKCTNVKVFGGHIKNCRRGSNANIGTSGKGVQFENGVKDILVEGTLVENCTYGYETGGIIDNGTDIRSVNNVLYSNIMARNCERLLSLQQMITPPSTDPAVNAITIDGLTAFNCGREQTADPKAYGLIIVDRATNYTIRNVEVYNDSTYGSVHSVIRQGRGERGTIENIKYVGDCDYIISHMIPAGFGTPGVYNENIIKDIQHFGTAISAIECGVGDSGQITNSTYLDIFCGTLTGNVLGDNIKNNAGLFGRFIKSDRSTLLEGMFNFITAYGGNAFPTVNKQASYLTKNVNGITFTFGASDQKINTVQDLTFNRNGAMRAVFTANGVRLGGIPTSATGLSAGDLWKDTAAGNVIKMV